jgi:hypothetical protein
MIPGVSRSDLPAVDQHCHRSRKQEVESCVDGALADKHLIPAQRLEDDSPR